MYSYRTGIPQLASSVLAKAGNGLYNPLAPFFKGEYESCHPFQNQSPQGVTDLWIMISLEKGESRAGSYSFTGSKDHLK